MKVQIMKLVAVFGVLLFLASCSAQNTTADTTATTEKRGEKPQGQGKQKKGERPTFAKILTEMDQNNDGKLSKTEVKGPLKNDFAKIDTNSDGFINEAEFKNAPKPQRGGGGGRH